MLSWFSRSGRRKADPGTSAHEAGSEAARAVEQGLQHHRAGRLPEAEAAYRTALEHDPENIDALHFLGVVAYQKGDSAQAIAWISKALARHAGNAAAHNNLGNALAAQGRTREAVHAFLEALALQPDYAEALANLGGALRALEKPARAVEVYRRALAISPDLPAAVAGLKEALAQRPPATDGATPEARAADAHFNEGGAQKDAGRLDEAIASYRKALALAPEFTAAHVNLGSAMLDQGRRAEAMACFRKALALDHGLPEAHYNLGIAAFQAGDLPAARSALAAYLRARPGDRLALLTLGEVHSRTNELDEAADCFEQLLARDAGDAAAHNLLANVRRNQARHAEAIAHYERAIRHDSNPVVPFQNLLFCLLCTRSASAAEVHARHREFARRFEQPLLGRHAPLPNAPEAERRLRIGYVSPDFRSNVVGHYMQPILEHHDRSAFDVHCYAIGSARDAVTDRIAALADRWHDVHALSDDDIAARIRADGIDLLVDLCGHGPGNRILVFARKPAPVQASYLDYSATTGLSAIDYRLTTEDCDPTGVADRYYSERLFRLGGGYWTYNPSVQHPVPALPARLNGYVTFGSFNLYYRITDEVVDLWSRVLVAVPNSRLLIVSVAAGSTQARLLERLARAGIASERVVVHGVVSYQRYHGLMGAADVALAPFPYNGATTVMDCLWNGLPVVALQGGETFWTRIGCSVLMQTGLQGMIARDADDYVRIAAELASSPAALEELRSALRRKLEQSPFRDFAGFTRELERAYRTMWREWCTSQTAASAPARGETPRVP